MTDVAIIDRPSRREITQVIDAVPILDSARFEHMQRVANVLARSSMIPETLRTTGRKDDKEDLPFEQVLSNCFLVVNQAARWGFDPFAVISCCAVVHGRLSYEGKLVSAVLDAKLDVQLHYHFVGDMTADAYRVYVLDQPFTPEITAQLKPGASIPGLRLWDGSVGEWKTTGAGTPWTPKNYRRMLIYRGARDWTRIYEPAIMLGVYTEDELLDLAEDARARRASPVVSLSERLALAKAQPGETNGFSQDHVKQQLGGTETEAQREAGSEADSAKTSPPASPASEQGSVSTDTGATDQPQSVLRSPQPNSSEASSAPQPPPQTMPAPEDVSPDISGAGPSSPEVVDSKLVSDGEPKQASEPGNTALQGPAGLPPGWQASYAAALKRASKPLYLPKRATEYWSDKGGWVAHKDGPSGETAQAIYDAFANHFDHHEARDAILHELGAA